MASPTPQSPIQAQPTPPLEDPPLSIYASYVPHDLAYSADFEDSLVDTILDAPVSDAFSPDAGIRVLSPSSGAANPQHPRDNASASAHPIIPESELPLSLASPLRTFPSPLPGIQLTHAYGYLEGGPGLDPAIDTFPDDFLASHPEVETAAELRRAVKREIAATVEVLRERLRTRREAKENNARIERELRTLLDQHSMEQKIHAKMAEEKVRKREAKERRRKVGRDGG